MSEESTTTDPYESSTFEDRGRPKKSKAWIWALVLGIGCFLPVVACVGLALIGGVSMVERSEWVRPLAIEFVETGQSGNTDAVYDMCSEALQGTFSKEDLDDVFVQLDELAGTFRSLGSINGLYMKVLNGEHRTEVSFMSSFDVGDVLLSFVFLEDGDEQLVERFAFKLQASAPVRRCPNCDHGHRNRNATFCEECGERLEAEYPTAEPIPESESESESVEPGVEDAAQDD